MELPRFVDDDLEDRAIKLASQRLTGLDVKVDTEYVEIDTEETFYRPPKKPKLEVTERLAIVRKKAQQARAIVNRQKRREPNLPDYLFSLYVIYFINHKNVQPRDILGIIRDEQRKKAEAVKPVETYNTVQKDY